MHKMLCLVLAIAILASGCSMSLQGDNGLEVSGDSDTKTVTLALDGTVVRGVIADSGNATALNNWLTLAGGGNVTVSASGNTVTITCVSGNSSSGSLPGLLPGHLFIGNESGLAQDMELTGDATLNSLGELSVGWADMCQLADTANTAGDSDTLDGEHGSYYAPACGVVVAYSSTTRNSNDALKSTSSTAYVKLKQMQLNEDLPSCTVYWQFSKTVTGGTAYSRVYVNGGAVGSEHTTSSMSMVAGSEVLSGLSSGDLIQIYCKTSTTTMAVQYQRLQYSEYIESIGGYSLVTHLVDESNPTISVTNQDP